MNPSIRCVCLLISLFHSRIVTLTVASVVSQEAALCDFIQATDVTSIWSEWTCADVGNKCTFTGVTCSGSNITRVRLYDGISGSLPSSIGDITALTYLHLGNNSLNGTLPSSLGQLASLVELYLYDNSLSGALPHSFSSLTKLQLLRGEDNMFTGVYPSELCTMTQLTTFYLTQNSYHECLRPTSAPTPFPTRQPSGIPTGQPTINLEEAALCDFIQATDVTSKRSEWTCADVANKCTFSGVICSGSHITRVHLYDDGISGSLPSSIGDMTALMQLYLGYNSLTGTLPSSIGDMTALTYLHIGSNSLIGTLPSSLGQLTSVSVLGLHYNSITGPLPSSIGDMTALTYLDMRGNSLSGTLPSSLGQLTSVSVLGLHYNSITGPLPSPIGDITALTYLHLGNNSLNGTLPSSLGQLASLVELYLHDNSLSGALPHSFSGLTKLQLLRGEDNMFTGVYPSELCTMTQLTTFYLTQNTYHECLRPISAPTPFPTRQPSGIPTGQPTINLEEAALCDFIQATDVTSKRSEWTCADVGYKCTFSGITCSGSHIVKVSLYNVGISGSLPPSFGHMTSLVDLRLHSNSLTGSLPSSIGDMTGLTHLSIRSNSFSGTLPSSLGQLISLGDLLLYNNFITGTLPSSLGQMTSLGYLSLSGNSLTGPLPSSLGQLTTLSVLYLYGNSLSGPLPDSFSSLTKLQLLRGEDNMFTGVYPTELCTMTELTTFYLTQNTYHECLRPTSAPTPFPTRQPSGIPTGQPTINLEEAALCDFIQATDVTSKRSEWTCADVGYKCNFSGITCSGSHIVKVSLYNVGISGSLPPSFGHMTSLVDLRLHSNSLTGSLPSSIGDMTGLTHLSIRSNSFSGTLPSSLGQLISLGDLLLYNNFITGTLPSSLGQMTSLGYLSLSGNSLTGPLPSSLGQLTTLSVLYLYGNSLSGPLPDSFSSLTKLQLLRGEDNMFTGVYPTELCTMTQLTTFYLTQNTYHECLRPTSAPTPFPTRQPSGIPTGQPTINLEEAALCDFIQATDVTSKRSEWTCADVGYKCTFSGITCSGSHIVKVSLYNVGISGSLPPSFGHMTSLVDLRLHSNSLTGSLPSSIGDMTGLTHLSIRSNSFSGTLPSSLGQLISLGDLLLYNNFITGTLPSSLGQMTSLGYLSLSGNSLTGPLPSSLGQLTTLSVLYLYGNSLSGPLPDSFSSLTKLQLLRGEDNMFTGVYPTELCTMTQLTTFYLTQNTYHECLRPTSAPTPFPSGQPTISPESSALCDFIQATDVTSIRSEWTCADVGNKCSFNGITCSGSHITSVDLRSVGISGSLPSSIGDMTALTYLHIRSNYLNGTLPSSLGRLTSLSYLNIGSNSITGPLPSSLGDLTALTYLDFGYNSLNGALPSSLGQLTSLVSLFLYVNSITGPLPSSMGDMNALTVFSIDSNSFTGTLPSSLGQLTSLVRFYITDNSITGPLPSSISDMTALTLLNFGSNSLNGTLPSSLRQLSSLGYLSLSGNSLTGPLPSTLGQLTTLSVLYLYGNSLSGPLPDSFSSLTKLRLLRGEDNMFTGVYPSELCTMTQLTTFYLTQNTYHECLRPTSAPTPFPSGQPTISPESSALCDFIQATDVTSIRSEWTCADVGNKCSFNGVTCSGSHITSVDLRSVGISGSLPSSIGDMTALTYLHIRSNYLNGTLPSSLGRLTSLSYLNIGSNSITGPLPSSLGDLTALTYLDFGYNSLNGALPSSLGQLTSLVSLFLYVNSITGPLPSSMGDMNALTVFSIDSNSFTGTLPSSLGQLTSLVRFYITDNSITGPLPSSISDMTALTLLNFGSNSLNGTLPSSLRQLSSLGYLSLSGNSLTGPLPSTLGQLTTLSVLYLYGNSLSGPLPDSFSSLTKLRLLRGEDNMFTGVYPSELCTMTQLTTFYLTQNTYHECLRPTSAPTPFPSGQPTISPESSALCDFIQATDVTSIRSEWTCADVGNKCSFNGVTCSGSHITSVDLRSVGISGSLPSSIGDMTALTYLHIRSNYLNGTLPSSLGRLTSLSYLNIGSNSITGPLPSSLGDLTALTYLDFGYNSLSGALPSSLGQLTSLVSLFLYVNSITGPLPSSMGDMNALTVFSIDSNSFTGTLPSSLGQLTSLVRFYITDNSITGPLPSSISDMTALTLLNFGSNSLNGTLPSSLRQLSSLGYLSLSGNSLTGPLPSTLGQLTTLSVLYLYGNSLSGPLPDSFSSLTKLRLLRGEDNMFTGVYPSELCTMTQLTTFYLTQNTYHECLRPTSAPTPFPTRQPSGIPTGQPSISGQPSSEPSALPSYQPTGEPSGTPTRQPSGEPTGHPSCQPTGQPSGIPTGQPTYPPTGQPSGEPSGQPSGQPTSEPSGIPTGQPSYPPTGQPSGEPSGQPSGEPSGQPSGQPTSEPSGIPTGQPSYPPTGQPSGEPSGQPSSQPTGQPSCQPTGEPSGIPTRHPSGEPTGQPSHQPTGQPSGEPSGLPSSQPTSEPSGIPTGQPSHPPTGQPSGEPSGLPSRQPTGQPSCQPTGEPSGIPTRQPSGEPSGHPSGEPTGQPSHQPTGQPSGEPSGLPSSQPTRQPSSHPSRIPTGQPSGQPTGKPSCQPTGEPSGQPSGLPSGRPTRQSYGIPTGQPSGLLHSTFPSKHAPSVAPLPEILRMDWTAYQDRVTLSIQLSDRGYVYCASYESMVIVDSVNSVISTNNFDYVDDVSVNASISITSLTPSTNYTLYCVTQNNDLLATSYEEMLSSAIVWETLCCKSIFVDLNMLVLQEYSVGWNMVAVTLSAAPSSDSDVWISAEVSNSSGSYTVSPFLDDTVTVTHSSWSKTHVFTVANCAPGLYTLQVTMMDFAVQQEYDVIFRSGQSFTVEPSAVEPSTPRLTSAQFSKSGESAVLKFDSPTDKALYSSYFKCSRLLDVAGASLSDCLWTSAITLTVYFKGPLLPEVGDSVVLLPGQLRAQCTSTTSECTGWVTVNRTEMVLVAPYDPISPTLVVTYPKVSGPCDRPVIDITASFGSGGRPWKHFNITVTSASNTVHTVQKWLTENYVISPPPAVPAQLFQGGYRYIFELWLCNFLGECSSAIAIIERVNDSLPYVSMVGKLSRQIFTYTPLALQSNAFLSECDGSASYSNLIYDWKIFEDEVEHSELVSLSSDPRKFKLPPYSLNVSSVYEIKLTVASSLSGLSSSVLVYVSVVQSDIVAIIEGGSQQSLRIGGSVLLDASGSYDKNIPLELRPPAESSGFEFRWTCMQLFPALLLRCDDLNIQSNTITTPHLLHIFTTNMTKEHSEYSISVEVLSIADGRQAESSVVVRVTEALAPIVTISRSGATSGVNPSSSLVLLGTVQLDVPQSAFWTINEPSVALASITSTATYVSLAKGLYSINLVVSAGSIPGRSVPYVFSLTCGSSTASLTVIFNAPPQPGQLSVFPPSGIAWDTVYTLIAESWTDEDLPLSYVMGYLENGHYPIVRSRLETSYASSTFPPGDSMNGYTLLCYVRVLDSLDAVSLLQTSVVARSNTALSATLASEKFRLELESSGSNIELTKQILSLSSSYLNTKNCSSAPNCTTLNRHECFSVDHTCGSCLAGYVGEEGASNHGCVPESDLLTPSPGVVCGTDDDCSVWEYCKITESPSICDYRRQTCTSNCSRRGTCILQDSDSGAAVTECLLIDSSCEAKCLCDKGFSGLFCEYTAEEARVRTDMREANLNELDGVTRVDDPTLESILEWQQILVTLTTQSSELSEVGTEHGLNIADVILSNATVQAVDTYEAYSDTLTAVDSIATVSMNILLSSLASSNITRHRSLLFNESSFIASRVASALDTYGSGVRRSLIEGQRGNQILRKSFQQITEVFSSSVNSEDISMAVPQSFAKTSAGILPSSLQFRRNSTRHPSRSLKVSLSSIRSKLYDNGNYNSDVLQLAIDGSIYTNDSFKIIIRNNNPIYYGRVHANNTTFNVTCDRDVYTTHILPCHQSAVNVTCNGTAAKVRLRCPDVFSAPHCRVLSTRGNFNCTVDSYTAWNTTCLCHLTSLGYHFGGDGLSSYDTNPSPSQRRVDETGQEQMILRESGYVELVSTSEYVAGDFTATVVLAQEFDSPEDLQAVLLVVSLFGTIWGMGFLAICYMFATSAYGSKSEKLKQCVTTPSLDLNSASPDTISTDSMKMRLHSYVKEVFPAVYNTKSPWSRLWRELRSHHRYIGLFLSKDYTNTVNHRIRVLLHLLTTLSMLMFFLALLYDFEYPEDNGKCEAHTTSSQCATEKSMLDSSQRVCQWVEDDDTIGGYSCVFVSPEVTLKAIMIASVICSIFSMFGNAIVDFIFDILAAPTACCSRQNAAEQINGHIQQRVAQFGRRVSAITTNLSDQFRSSVGRKRKTSSFITIESTRHLPYSCIAAQQLALSSLGSIVAEVNPSLQTIERRSSRSQRLSRNTDTPHPQSSNFQSYYALCPVSRRSEEVDKVAAIPSTILSISTDDLYADLCSDITEQMRYLRTTRQKDAFMMAWCLESNNQFKPEYASIIEKTLKEHLAFVKKEVALKRNKLNQIEDMHIGLELLHMFVLDVLGRASPAAKIFETKSEEEFRHTYVVSKFVKGIMWTLVVLLNLCFIFYSMLRGLQRGLEWQIMFLFACILQFLFEILLYESSEVAIIHFVIPSLVRYEVMTAQTALYNAIESISNMSEETNDLILDTPQYLFVSVNVAKFFPHQLESAIVRSYHSLYPGVLAKNWKDRRKFYCRRGAVVPSGRNYTRRFSVIAVLSLLVQQLGAVSSTWQRMIIHLLQPLLAVSMIMMWQYMWYHPIYFVVLLVLALYVGYRYFSLWKNQAEEQNSNKVGLFPALVLPDSSASGVPGEEGTHRLNTDSILLATEEGHSPGHLSSDPIHQQRRMNDFPSILEVGPDTTIGPPLSTTALDPIVAADTDTEGAAVANTSYGDSSNFRPAEKTSLALQNNTAPDGSIAMSNVAHLLGVDFSSDSELESPDTTIGPPLSTTALDPIVVADTDTGGAAVANTSYGDSSNFRPAEKTSFALQHKTAPDGSIAMSNVAHILGVDFSSDSELESPDIFNEVFGDDYDNDYST